MRSVEIMVPCPWFEEACCLLNENPGLDVRTHLLLTSERMAYNWLTYCPGLTDDAGYFFPMLWLNEYFPENQTLLYSDWNIEEVEAKLRAQISLSIERVPHISHPTSHMGWRNANPQLTALFDRLAKEYDLEENTTAEEMKDMGLYEKSGSSESQAKSLFENLKKLAPGTWILVEHPAYERPEMQGYIIRDMKMSTWIGMPLGGFLRGPN